MAQLPPDRSVVLALADRDDPTRWHQLTGWQSYEITHQLMQGIPAFRAVLAPSSTQRDLVGTGGQRVQVWVDGALQFAGILDEVSRDASTSAMDLEITGRGVAGQLADCSIPPVHLGQNMLSNSGCTLLQIANRILTPWMPDPIPSVVMDAAASKYVVAGGAKGAIRTYDAWDPVALTRGVLKLLETRSSGPYKPFGRKSPYYRGVDRDKLQNARIDPGATPWATLQRLAAQVGAHVWSAVDGTVIITRPCYQFDPSAYGEGLTLRWDKAANRATGGTVKGAQVETTCAERGSEYQVWGMAKGNKKTRAKDLVGNGWTLRDPSPAFWNRQSTPPYLSGQKLYRPKLLTFKGVADAKLVRRIAMRAMEDAAIKSISMDYEVHGHHAPTGPMWAVDTMVDCWDELHGIFGPHYITTVQFKFSGVGNPPPGKTTRIGVIPPDVWLPDFDPDAISDDAYMRHMVNRIWW